MTTLAQDFGITADQAQALTSKAFDLLDAGDLDGAVIIFTGILVLNPFDAGVYAALGSVLHEQGKLTEAEAAYDEAIRLDGDTVLARVNRGDIRLKRGDAGGFDDLEIAAGRISPIQQRAKNLLRFYAR